MKYKRFTIPNYKALIDSSLAIIDTPVPVIGVNESGKSSALEAVAHFDYRNDEIIAAKDWKFINRYKPEVAEFSVDCVVGMSQSELDEVRTKHLLPEPEPVAEAVEPTEGEETPEQPPAAPEPVVDELLDITLERDTITITRTFNSTKQDKPYSVNGIAGERADKLAKDIIKNLPRIYYFDNFLERPMPDAVEFSPTYIAGTTNTLNEEQKIIEGAFASAGVDLRDFFNNKDRDSQDTLIQKVSAHVTKSIIDDWRKMHIPNGELDLTKYHNVRIGLKLGEKKKSIEIKVIEQFPGEDGEPQSPITMKLSERSQGFRWFFNFSARKCFAAVHEERFVYLIDEPGSFLHNGAQEVLLDALIDLAKLHPVIYSTHTEFLLDPEKININDIKIVQKEDHAIKLIPMAQASTDRHEGALSTLYNALRMRTPLETIMNKKVVVTEGITDFYLFKPLVDVAFLPGCGAGNNRYLLSIAIGASKKYTAMFDGDEAGDQAIELYKGFFGEAEATNWFKYETSKGKPCKLEGLLSAADVTKLKTITGQASLKQAITFMFFDESMQNTFWKGINQETRANIQHNIDKISKQIVLSKTSVKYGFTA